MLSHRAHDVVDSTSHQRRVPCGIEFVCMYYLGFMEANNQTSILNGQTLKLVNQYVWVRWRYGGLLDLFVSSTSEVRGTVRIVRTRLI